jgi:DNA-binding transcriptional ArsR family regulator
MATDGLSTTLFALADPTRRGLLAQLARGEATVKELAAPYDMSVAAVSKHLKVLEGAGLIIRGREAQWRPCRLKAAPLKDACEWLAGFQQFWERNSDSLDAYLTSLAAAAGPARKPRKKRSR